MVISTSHQNLHGFLVGPVWNQEFDSTNHLGPFQLRILYDSVKSLPCSCTCYDITYCASKPQWWSIYQHDHAEMKAE